MGASWDKVKLVGSCCCGVAAAVRAPQRVLSGRYAGLVGVAAAAVRLPRGAEYAHALVNNLFMREEGGAGQPGPDVAVVQQLRGGQLSRHNAVGVVELVVTRYDAAVLDLGLLLQLSQPIVKVSVLCVRAADGEVAGVQQEVSCGQVRGRYIPVQAVRVAEVQDAQALRFETCPGTGT